MTNRAALQRMAVSDDDNVQREISAFKANVLSDIFWEKISGVVGVVEEITSWILIIVRR